MLELIVDGYAHVLALNVDRRRLEREIVLLAQSGDPRTAVELGRISALLRDVTSTSEALRQLLDAVRSDEEHHG